MTEAEKAMARDAMRQAIETERDICARIAEGCRPRACYDEMDLGKESACDEIAARIRGQK